MKLQKDINNLIDTLKKTFYSKKDISLTIEKIYNTLKKGNKVYICGNGGSAGEAQHLAAEFLVRLNPKTNRRPFPVITLAQDTSTLTAIGNDYDFRFIFSRNLKALANKNDILIVLSTSGNSKNIIEVLKVAKKIKVFTIALLGFNGGNAKRISDVNIVVPSNEVARIQETHLFLGHHILNEVEKKLLRKL